MGMVDNIIIGPHFFPEHINITVEVYSEFLEETLPNLLDDIPLNIWPNIIYQQDGHPAHTSVLARAILNRRFTHRWIDIHNLRSSAIFKSGPRSHTHGFLCVGLHTRLGVSDITIQSRRLD